MARARRSVLRGIEEPSHVGLVCPNLIESEGCVRASRIWARHGAADESVVTVSAPTRWRCPRSDKTRCQRSAGFLWNGCGQPAGVELMRGIGNAGRLWRSAGPTDTLVD